MSTALRLSDPGLDDEAKMMNCVLATWSDSFTLVRRLGKYCSNCAQHKSIISKRKRTSSMCSECHTSIICI